MSSEETKQALARLADELIASGHPEGVLYLIKRMEMKMGTQAFREMLQVVRCAIEERVESGTW